MSKDSHENDESFSIIPEDGEGNVLSEDDSAISAKKLKALKEKLAVCLTEKEGYLLGWQRERADFANFKKEASEREARQKELAIETILEDIIPVLDSFSMAFANKEAWESVDKNWRTGVEYIHQQLAALLSSYGLEPFTDVGKLFDPARHVATETKVVSDKKDDHTILSVIQSGYMLKGRVLRPARVVVGALDEENL